LKTGTGRSLTDDLKKEEQTQRLRPIHTRQKTVGGDGARTEGFVSKGGGKCENQFEEQIKQHKKSEKRVLKRGVNEKG